MNGQNVVEHPVHPTLYIWYHQFTTANILCWPEKYCEVDVSIPRAPFQRIKFRSEFSWIFGEFLAETNVQPRAGLLLLCADGRSQRPPTQESALSLRVPQQTAKTSTDINVYCTCVCQNRSDISNCINGK